MVRDFSLHETFVFYASWMRRIRRPRYEMRIHNMRPSSKRRTRTKHKNRILRELHKMRQRERDIGEALRFIPWPSRMS